MENQHHISVSDELIARYLAGEAQPEEARALYDWLQSPANKEHFEAMSSTWRTVRPEKKQRDVNVTAAWSLLEQNMQATAIHRRYTNRRLWLYVSMAAGLTLFITLSFWYFASKTTQAKPRLVETADTLKHIRLPDESSVTLNRHSVLSFPEPFGEVSREVALQSGEGFFNVTTDQQKPFTVHTPLGNIRVVGTSFNVRVDNARLEVGVREGRVMLIARNDTVALDAGSSAALVRSGNAISVSDSADVNEWSYATRFFVFRDTPLQEVIVKIAKSYGCEVKIANQNINRCRLTATFDNVSVENMLSLIAETLNLSVERNGRVFTIQGEGCH